MQKIKIFSIIISGIIFLLYNDSFAQSNDDCLMCHEDKSLVSESTGKSLYVQKSILKKSSHARLLCTACHKDAKGEIPHKEKLKAVNCGSCHKTYQEQVQNDIHHKLFSEEKETFPTCKICHGTHNIEIPSSVPDKSQKYCETCHEDEMLSAPYHVKMEINESCKECHNEFNYKSQLSNSVHAKLSCSNCHGYVINNIDDHSQEPADGKLADCYLCHHDIANEHQESIHGISISAGIKEAAQCWDCHGAHNILPVSSDSSKVNICNLTTTCAKCHDDINFIRNHNLRNHQPGKMYSTSVHAKLLKDGCDEGATCIKCHGTHNIKNRMQANSKIANINVSKTCAECHKEIAEEYEKSIHWTGVKKGIQESPTCNNCHSEHDIHAINTTNKREEIKKIQEQTCIWCHQNLILSKRFGFENTNVSNYQDSYHGLSVNKGGENAAMCVDCHGVHKILPAFHEESTISKHNVVATCKKCHKNATETFAQSYSHKTQANTQAEFIENIVEKIYIWLIIIVIGGMLLHNIIIFIHEIKSKYIKSKQEIRIPRFTKNELIQHFILLSSFIILAITGFLLKLNDNWLSNFLLSIGFDEIIRRNTHRVAAVIMTALSVYHVFYLIFTSRGRDVLKSIFPRFSDIKHAIQNIKYHLNLTKKHPEFDNYNYIEKAEYWALIWGTILMVATGFVLWFPTFFGNLAPVWLIKVSEIIHFYEAILATLAIIVWHWFFVIFRPKEYPLSFASIDGKITLKHYKEEHMLKFKKFIAEWNDVQSGKIKKNKISNFSKLIVSSLEKQGVDVDEFVKQEIEKNKI